MRYMWLLMFNTNAFISLLKLKQNETKQQRNIFNTEEEQQNDTLTEVEYPNISTKRSTKTKKKHKQFKRVACAVPNENLFDILQRIKADLTHKWQKADLLKMNSLSERPKRDKNNNSSEIHMRDWTFVTWTDVRMKFLSGNVLCSRYAFWGKFDEWKCHKKLTLTIKMWRKAMFC